MGRRIVSSHESADTPHSSNASSQSRSTSAASSSVSTGNAAGRKISSSKERRNTGEKNTGMTRTRTARAVASHTVTADGDTVRHGFVDARRMPSEDALSATLNETAGALGLPVRPKIVDFDARLKERRRAGRRVLALRLTAIIASLVAICALAWLLFLSPVFRLETSQISVTGGNAWVSRDDILAIADKQSGKSLFLVSSKDVVTQLQNIPGVTEAQVSKKFPKSLSVSVKAQQPAAMLKTASSGLVAVDDQGRILNTVGDVSTEGIPVIEVKDVTRSLDNKAIQEALKVLGSLSSSMRGSITKVTAATQDSITTELNGGEHVVVWGDSSDLELKKAIVDKILSDPNVIGDKTQVDVSAPSRPIIK